MEALGLWMFISKFIKLMGHYIRYPVDVLLLPVSILFGYFHGIIKIYAVLTLNVVSFNFLLFFFFHFFAFFWASGPMRTIIIIAAPQIPWGVRRI